MTIFREVFWIFFSCMSHIQDFMLYLCAALITSLFLKFPVPFIFYFFLISVFLFSYFLIPVLNLSLMMVFGVFICGQRFTFSTGLYMEMKLRYLKGRNFCELRTQKLRILRKKRLQLDFKRQILRNLFSRYKTWGEILRNPFSRFCYLLLFWRT